MLDLVEAYKNHSRQIFTFIFLRVNKNREIAEDILQETFLKAFKYKDKYNPELANEKTWLIAIAKNLVTDYYKGRYKYVGEKLEDFVDYKDESVSLEESVDEKLEYESVVKALDLLSDKDRELIILRYINELELEEISKILEMSYDNVKVSVHRAVVKLREILKINYKSQ
ncbi:RNA polymerase sigma factor [Candidatus Dojkabacteria bacterium]|nr:RNA polymerase sigma factor [Candidatus Dojkabacteria bacterium]